ncbi:MAG: helix-turn-helix domain-containing protein [Desulfonatronovibrio sp.]
MFDLLQEVRQGRFRADLFYRLAVAMIRLPSLKHRPGDISLLIDKLLDDINREAREEPGFQPKNLAPSARNILLEHAWPGNVRELMNTLLRAAIWSDESSISQEDVLEAMLPMVENQDEKSILNRSLEQDLDLPGIMGEVAGHYIRKALQETGGNKTRAARLLGLKNYQTLDNWMEKYKV